MMRSERFGRRFADLKGQESVKGAALEVAPPGSYLLSGLSCSPLSIITSAARAAKRLIS